MTRHTWQCFSSKAVCQPNFSYNMNHGIRTWGSSLSVWIKSYNQNNRISAVMKTNIPTTNYNHATNFFAISFIFHVTFHIEKLATDFVLQRCFCYWEKQTILRYVFVSTFRSQKSNPCWFPKEILLVISSSKK